MSEKFYKFSVPVTIRAMRTIWLYAESEQEAREKLLDGDWNDCDDEHRDDQHDWHEVVLEEVEDCEEAA
jgi:hypothetical protein